MAAGGRFTKDRFDIDLDADTVRRPAGNTTPIVRDRKGAWQRRVRRVVCGVSTA